jgi:hypothetical protein
MKMDFIGRWPCGLRFNLDLPLGGVTVGIVRGTPSTLHSPADRPQRCARHGGETQGRLFGSCSLDNDSISRPATPRCSTIGAAASFIA